MQIAWKGLGWFLIGYLLGMIGWPMWEIEKMRSEAPPPLERVIGKWEAWHMAKER